MHKSVSTSLYVPAESGFWRAEFHFCGALPSDCTPIFIFTLLPLERLRPFGQHLAESGHPVAVISTGCFPWEITASELVAIFDEVLEAAPFPSVPPCLFGIGFDGLTALLLASRLPHQRISSLALDCASPFSGTSWLYRNGVLTGSALAEILECLGLPSSPALLCSFRNWQQGASPLSFAPDREEWLLELCRQDGTFFRRRHELDGEELLKKCCGIPTLLCGSWHHITAAGILKFSWHISQTPRIPFQLHLTEKKFSLRNAYTPAADTTTLLLQWIKNFQSASKAGNYCYFMSDADGKGSWHKSLCWPPLSMVNQIWHLAGTALTPALPNDTSAPATRFTSSRLHATPAEHAPLDFAPCPAVNNAGVPTAFAAGTAVFSLPPLKHSLTLLGIPRLVLWLTCSRCDAAFAARLTIQLSPSENGGKFTPPIAVSTGICRLALRCDPQLPLINDVSDVPVSLNFELQPMALHIPAGAILRLEITSGEEPRFLPQLFAEQGGRRRIENAVWHTPRYPSRLLLPVLNKAPPIPAPNAQANTPLTN